MKYNYLEYLDSVLSATSSIKSSSVFWSPHLSGLIIGPTCSVQFHCICPLKLLQAGRYVSKRIQGLQSLWKGCERQVRECCDQPRIVAGILGIFRGIRKLPPVTSPKQVFHRRKLRGYLNLWLIKSTHLNMSGEAMVASTSLMLATFPASTSYGWNPDPTVLAKEWEM